VPFPEACPIQLDGERGTLDAFSALAPLADAARAAYIVEMDHFIHEKYDFRLLCIRYLASRGWRWCGEEIDRRQGERIDRYLTGGDGTLLDAIDDPVLLVTAGEHERVRVTQMHNMVMTCRLDEQVDAIVFAPHVTPLRGS
jgi:erythromycin esterase-like protein